MHMGSAINPAATPANSIRQAGNGRHNRSCNHTCSVAWDAQQVSCLLLSNAASRCILPNLLAAPAFVCMLCVQVAQAPRAAAPRMYRPWLPAVQ
jgi:hypothetical protein